MAAYYKDGVIAIPRVTGDLVITVTAVKQGPVYTNILDDVGYEDGKRVSLSTGEPKDAANRVVVGTISGGIPCTAGDVIRVKGLTYPAESDSTVVCGAYIGGAWGGSGSGKATYLYGSGLETNYFRYTIDGDLLTVTIKDDSLGATVTGIKLNGIGATGSGIVVTKNEEIT